MRSPRIPFESRSLEGGSEFSTFFLYFSSCAIHLPWDLGIAIRTHNVVRTALFILITLFMGCGAVGKPIPPEEVGIEAKVKKQQEEAAGKDTETPKDQVVPETERPEELPPFFPIGVR